MTRDCLPPHPVDAAEFALPPGACDSHAHVFGPYSAYPLAADRSYTPPENPGPAYLRQLDTLGFARGVLVTASAYGDQNQPVLDALRAAPDRLRGVAVLSADVTDAALDTMTDAGVRGVRVNLFRRDGQQVYRNGMDMDTLNALAPRVRERGWHLQAWIHAPDIPECWPGLQACGLPVVIDHMGRMSTRHGVDNAGFRFLCERVRDGAAWAKISGADRTTAAGPPYTDVDPFAAALIRANPARLVWGSDWPHINYFDTMPRDADLLRALFRWTDAAQRQQILVDNPAALYGFPPVA